MIQSITLIKSSENFELAFEKHSQKTVINFASLDLSNCSSFNLKIVFSQPIIQFRNHDYTWKKSEENWIANEFCPKIIKLQNGQLVQANVSNGIWEFEKNNTSTLLWRFNPESAASITNYSGNSNSKTISQANQKFEFTENLTLLFPKSEGIEFSRSKIPFTAVACFTDHCDFDTAENLVTQRTFFKEHQIKITKGFFLNHFSKRSDNASFENQKEEILSWKNDGHELCYHSLSQSIKSDAESVEDFAQFIPPSNDIKVWIDHGFQPYNLSLFKKNNIAENDFANNFVNKNINILWNYIDSGTATNGVINQLNTQHFTLSSFLEGNKNYGFVKKMQLMIKNIIFHYYNDERMILRYKHTAMNFKKVFFQKKIKSFFPFVEDFSKLGDAIFSVLLSWNKNKNKPYKFAKYAPILFKHTISDNDFYVFQTLEMLDFKKSLSQQNIKTLIKEKGVFIAHTYFSVPMEYHDGKLLSTPTTVDKKVADNFKFLSEKIQNKEIWNPTLSELIEYWSRFEKVILDIDVNGNIFEKNVSGLTMQKVI